MHGEALSLVPDACQGGPRLITIENGLLRLGLERTPPFSRILSRKFSLTSTII